MPNILDFLTTREIEFRKSHQYVAGKKAVLDLLEYEAAKPTNNQACEFTGEPRATFLVDFSPNMLRAASTHGDHSVRVSDVQTGKCTHVLTGHPRTPWCLAFNPTSNDILASGCLGGEVRIWDLLGGGSEVLHNPSFGAVITSLAFHPSGQVLVFATMNCIYFWDWNKPTPFAVTKTCHEYERIRWLRFDPGGHYLYTGIANNTTLHREGVRNVVNMRDSRGNTPRSEEGSGRDARSILFRNRMRYNQLMQRFRSFQESQNQRPDYPENVRPRSPVHEENLNMARQYANHVTESMSGSVFNVRDNGSSLGQRPQDSHSRPGIIREDFLLQRREENSSRRRSNPIHGNRWGRYQPSFFTVAGAVGSNNNNNNNGSRTGSDGNNNTYTIYLPRPQSGNRDSRPRAPAGLGPSPGPPPGPRISVPLQRPGFPPIPRQPAIPYSSTFYDPSFPPWPQGLEPYSRLEDLEADEFEILPVDQNNPDPEADGNASEDSGLSLRERMSIDATARNLELQLRGLRHELYTLAQHNVDVNTTILSLPHDDTAHRVGPPVGPVGSVPSVSWSSARSAGSALSRSMFSRSGTYSTSTSAAAATSGRPVTATSSWQPGRSAGSALSRSMFSRSGINNSSASSSSVASTSSSSAVTNRSILSHLVGFSRSVQPPSNVSTVSFNSNSELRGASSSTASSSSARFSSSNSQIPDHQSVRSSQNGRDDLGIVPTTLTDNTSQTFGAMNLPERLDQSTDISGLGNNQCQNSSLVKSAACKTKELGGESENGCVTTSSASVLPSLQQCVHDSNNVDYSNSLPSVHSSASPENIAASLPISTSSLFQTSSSSSRFSVPSHTDILRNALIAPSSSSTSLSSSSSSSLSGSSLLSLSSSLSSSSPSSSFLSSSSSISQSAGGRSAFFALNTSVTTSARNEHSTSANSHSNLSSTMNNSIRERTNSRQVFRSISQLRNRISDIMAENRSRPQHTPYYQILNQNNNNRTSASSNVRSESHSLSNNTSNDSASLASSNNASNVATPESRILTSASPGGIDDVLRSSIENVQRRLSDVLNNMASRGLHNRDMDGDIDSNVPSRFQHSVQRLREMEYRILSQTSQVLSQTTAYWTEFLERSVLEMNRRISDLERRLETNRYLLSSNPFSQQRPGRPHDALISRLVRERMASPGSSNNSSIDSDRQSSEEDRSLGMSRSAYVDVQPSSTSTSTEGDSSLDERPSEEPRQRNQLLLDFLVWRGSRDSQSQRSLSFGQSAPNRTQSSSSSSSTSSSSSLLSSALTSSNPEHAIPNLLTPSTAATSSSSSSSVPLSITIHPSREGSEEEEAMEGTGTADRTRHERREESGQRRMGVMERNWRNLQQVHLHPDYSSSILDDTINRPNEAMQHMMNRTIAGVLDREEQAVASNIIPQTHRIQRWDISEDVVPDISRAYANIVVEQCKLHNDASCDISQDGTLLATFVPSHRGFPDDNILGVFSLKKETFGQCLYTKSFGPNAISVSISPANHYVMVGLAARRYFLFSLSNKMVGQVFKMVKEKAGEKSMKHITDLYHPRVRGVQLHISVNFGRWLPGIGEGMVYGTNRGDLHFCRPGPRRVPDADCYDSGSSPLHSSRTGAVRSSIATQTTTVSIRRTASTQTLGDDMAQDESSSSTSDF